jgi:DNA-binding transcriptional MerR regulator
MEVIIPDKAYFRIGEVGKILGLDPYVIRFWESEFKSVKPIRTKSSQRLYRRKDVEELVMIRKLLYTENYTIRGAKQQLLKLKGQGTEDHEKNDREVLIEIKKGLQHIRELVG